ncbi:MAG: hypothetical protein ACI4UA_00970 [Bacteroidaceae bacterium]
MDKDVIERAIRAMSSLIEKEPENARLLMERGRLHMMAGEKELAIKDLLQAATIDPHLLDDMNGQFHAEK